MTILARARVILEGDTVALTKSLRGAEAAMMQAGRRMNAIGKTMSMKLTLPIVAVGAVSIKAFADFDDAMVQSIAIMGDVSDAMRHKMEEAAKDVARTTTFSAKKAAESYFFLASAGLDAKQSIAALPQVAIFAQAGMFNMATATDLATDAQSALGLTVDDAQQNLINLTRVTDVLVKANTLANASVIQFSESLTREAGAALKVFKIDIEEGVAVLAAFADQGVKAQLSGTGLARILRLLTAAATKHKDELAGLNIEVFDSTGKIRNLADVIFDMEQAFGVMSDETRTAALETIGFTAKVQGILLPLLGTSEAIRKYEAALRDAGGTTREVADKQLESFKSQLKLVWNQLVLGAEAAGKTMAPAVLVLGKSLKEVAHSFEEMGETTRTVLIAIVALIAVVGPGLIVLGTATVLIGKLTVALRLMLPHITVVTSSLWLMRIALGGILITALGTFITMMIRTKIAVRESAKAMEDAADKADELLQAVSPEKAENMIGAHERLVDRLQIRINEINQEIQDLLNQPTGFRRKINIEIIGKNEAIDNLQETIDAFKAKLVVLKVIAGLAEDPDLELEPPGVKGVKGMSAAVKEAVDELKATWAGAIEMNKLFGESFNLAEEQASILESGIMDLVMAGAAFEEVVGPNGETLRELAERYLALTKEIDDAREAQDALTASQEEAKAIIAGLLTPTQIYDQTVARLTVHLDAERLSQKEYNLAVAQAQEVLAEATKSANMWGKMLQKVGANALRGFLDLTAAIGMPSEATQRYNAELEKLRLQLELGRITQEEFNLAVLEAKDASDAARVSFREFIGSVIEDLRRLAAEQLILNLLANLGRAAASSGGDVPELQHGGFVRGGGLALVGEAGPELIRAGRGGVTVAPMRGIEFAPAGGGAAPQVNVTIQAVDARSFADLVEANPAAIVAPFVQALARSSALQGVL